MCSQKKKEGRETDVVIGTAATRLANGVAFPTGWDVVAVDALCAQKI